MSLLSSLPAFLSGLLPVFLVMAFIALAELVIPLHKRKAGGRRVRVNLALMMLTLGLNFFLSILLVTMLAYGRTQGWSLISLDNEWLDILLVIVVLDFATWLAHLMLHKVPYLWRLHLVHHTDSLVDVTTSFRQHPGEGGWRFVVIAIFAMGLGATPEAVAAYRALSALNALFEHGNFRVVSWVDRLLALVWVTPNFHKLHHSSDQTETDTNYGNLLPVFDRVFRTYTSPQGAASVHYGIVSYPDASTMSLRQILRLPFVHWEKGKLRPPS